MWMFFKREVMFFELPGAGGNDIFWAPRTVYLQHLRILWCIIHIKEFLTMLAYFIWMCFWFLYRKKDRALALSLARSLISNSNNSITYYSSLSRAFSLSLSLFLFLSLESSHTHVSNLKKKNIPYFYKIEHFFNHHSHPFSFCLSSHPTTVSFYLSVFRPRLQSQMSTMRNIFLSRAYV